MKKELTVKNMQIQEEAGAGKAYGAAQKRPVGTPTPRKRSGHIEPIMRGRPLCPSGKTKAEDASLVSSGAGIAHVVATAVSVMPESEKNDAGKMPHILNKIMEKSLKGLATRVNGFTLKETKITYEQGKDGKKQVKNEVVITKKIAPDLAAILFALTNLDGRNWKNKPDALPEETPAVDEDDSIDLSALPETLLQMLKGFSDESHTGRRNDETSNGAGNGTTEDKENE